MLKHINEYKKEKRKIVQVTYFLADSLLPSEVESLGISTLKTGFLHYTCTRSSYLFVHLNLKLNIAVAKPSTKWLKLVPFDFSHSTLFNAI